MGSYIHPKLNLYPIFLWAEKERLRPFIFFLLAHLDPQLARPDHQKKNIRRQSRRKEDSG